MTSMPAAARNGSTGGSAISSPGIIGMFGSIGGMRQPPPIIMWPAWSISWAAAGGAGTTSTAASNCSAEEAEVVRAGRTVTPLRYRFERNRRP